MNDKIKCITFDKEAQDALPEDIKERMRADRERARQEQACKEWDKFLTVTFEILNNAGVKVDSTQLIQIAKEIQTIVKNEKSSLRP